MVGDGGKGCQGGLGLEGDAALGLGFYHRPRGRRPSTSEGRHQEVEKRVRGPGRDIQELELVLDRWGP